MGIAIDLTGKRFGKLTAIRKHSSIKNRVHWEFICDCGNSHVADGSSAKSGGTNSCGCTHIESAKRNGKLTKGPISKHRLSHTPEYAVWKAMKQRCGNPNDAGYKHYGGLGVSVCERWKESFDNFIQDMGFRPSDLHSIDRTNPYGNYEPENCRWVTLDVQANNKRKK